MPKRNLTATQIWVHPRRKPNERIVLDSIPSDRDQDDLKYDYLHMFHGFAQEVTHHHLHHSVREQWVSILDIPAPKGRTVTVVTEAGRYGEEGSAVDTSTGKNDFSYTPNHSIQVTTHGVLIVPEKSPYAILFQERSNNRSGAGRVHDVFIESFKKKFPHLMVRTAPILEGEAWLQAAELMEVEVIITHPSTDEADFDKPKINNATFSYNIQPSRGTKSLPRKIYDGLVGRTIKPEDLVALNKGAETGQVFVTLAKDGRRKSFELHHQNEPVASILLSNHGEDAPTLTQIYSRSVEEAADYFPRLGVEWKESYVHGKWNTDQLAVRAVRPE